MTASLHEHENPMALMAVKEHAMVMPLVGTMDSFAGGVFDKHGEFIADSVVERGKRPQLQAPVEHLPGTCIYGGCLFAHFGHFIWESLSRLSAIRKCNNYPIVFITSNDRLFDTQKILFKSIGIDNQIILVKAPTTVEKLIYATPQSSINPVAMSGLQLESLACRAFEHCNPRRKIWLSRSRLKYGLVHNEKYIEDKLRRFGFEIIHPETISPRDQIELIATSRIVAGFEGSQFFSLLFAQNSFSEFYVFNRRPHILNTLAYMFKNKHCKHHLYKFALQAPKDEIITAASNYTALEQDRIIDILVNA